MSLLLDLATELLQQIIAQIYHQDLVNLALTCRHINKLSQSALQRHQELRSKYSVVSNAARPGGVLAEVTADVLRDPRIGLYVSRLNIGPWYTKWTAPDQTTALPAHNEYPKDTMHIVGEGGAIIETLFESEIYTWLDSFKEGDEDAVIALLLLNLPNLETLSLMTVYDCKYLHLALELAQGGSDQGYLSRLHSVNLLSAGVQSFDTLQRFARIPSVRVIKASGNWGSGSPWDSVPQMLISPSAGEYNLDNVILNDCRLELKALHSFIENTSGLRCFSWVSCEYILSSLPTCIGSELAYRLPPGIH